MLMLCQAGARFGISEVFHSTHGCEMESSVSHGALEGAERGELSVRGPVFF